MQQRQIDRLNNLYEIAHRITDSNYQNFDGNLSVEQMMKMILATALQGKYAVIYQFPETVAQALVMEQQGQKPNFNPHILGYYKSAVRSIVAVFNESQFKLELLANGGGFKISWDAPLKTENKTAPKTENKTEKPVDEKDNIDDSDA